MPAGRTDGAIAPRSRRREILGRAASLLLAAVAVVLIVACLNVGGLLMGRAVARDRETAIRVALGAGSRHLLRLWFSEAAILGLAGTAGGLLLAELGVRALKAAAPPNIPRLDAIAIDGPTLVIAFAALALTVGISTAVLTGRASATSSIERWEERIGAGRRSAIADARGCGPCSSLRNAAARRCSLALAAMLTRSFGEADGVGSRMGIPSHVLSLEVSPPMPGLSRPWFENVLWSDDLIARLQATPGISRAVRDHHRSAALGEHRARDGGHREGQGARRLLGDGRRCSTTCRRAILI